MRKVELSLKEKQKYEIIKKLVETNGNKERARIKLKLKSIRQINRLIAGYKEFGKEFFVHGNRGRKPKHALTDEFKNEIETLYTSKYFDCTYTQFTEYLAERENIFLSVQEANAFLPIFLDKYNSKFSLCIDNTKSVFEKQPTEQKINLTLAILSRRVVDTGHSICFKKKHYRRVNSVGTPIYFVKGTKCMVIEAFDKKLYATVEDSIFALEEIPEVQALSENFDEILPTEPKKIYIPRMIHPFKRDSFEKFVAKQIEKIQKELEKVS